MFVCAAAATQRADHVRVNSGESCQTERVLVHNVLVRVLFTLKFCNRSFRPDRGVYPWDLFAFWQCLIYVRVSTMRDPTVRAHKSHRTHTHTRQCAANNERRLTCKVRYLFTVIKIILPGQAWPSAEGWTRARCLNPQVVVVVTPKFGGAFATMMQPVTFHHNPPHLIGPRCAQEIHT